jgi:L-aspartate oxidase
MMVEKKPGNYYDYIIVGSGIAGLYTALLAKDHGSVLVLTKGSISDCNTKYAQGGIAAPIGENDSTQLHLQDTLAAGAGLCDPAAVGILVEQAADRIADLIRFGVLFDTVNGQIALAREAAHSVPRILHVGGDATGEYIEVMLGRRIREAGVRVLEHCVATQILLEDGKLRGIEILDAYTGSVEAYECNHIILATGGAGRLYKFTTNSDIATGDGIALAYNAGAEIADMEFFQFHPTALRLPGVTPFLISEAVRGEGGILRNIENRDFMGDYSPDKELATRDVVSRSIVYEMQKTDSDHVFLDVTHLPPALVTTRFPNIYHFCLDQGIDITRELIPVAPAAHYQIGGVKVNTWGETNIPNIYAVGEVSCTGVHGANRLASNSLLEAIVFGKRIIERSLQTRTARNDSAAVTSEVYSLPERQPPAEVPALRLPVLQNLLWDKAGIIRSGKDLEYTASLLAAWQDALGEPTDRATIELANLLTSARLMTEAALIRKESRGAHYRTDFPSTAPEWEKHIIFRREQVKKSSSSSLVLPPSERDTWEHWTRKSIR